MSRQLCTCCRSVPLARAAEQPFAIETPLKDGGRISHPLCPACIVFVGEEIYKHMQRGGGFKVVENAIRNVTISYENGRKAQKAD